jgi:hypothetical protein
VSQQHDVGEPGSQHHEAGGHHEAGEQESQHHEAGGHVSKPHFAVDKVWPGIMLGVIEDFVVVPGDEAKGRPSLTIEGSTAEPGRVLKSSQQKADAATPNWQRIGKSVKLGKGDAFYVLDSKITMTVNNASVAYIRIVGVDPKRRKDCNGRAC